MGSELIGKLTWAQSYAFIGIKGNKKCIEKMGLNRANRNDAVTVTEVF